MRSAMVSAVSLAFLGGCLDFGEGDAKVPGHDLGSYHVTGRLQEDTCQASALGVSDPWQFEVKLSRFQRDLYWLNGREAIVGDIAADDVSFRFQTRVDVDLEEAHGGVPGCVIERADLATGKLSSPGSDVSGFNGQMSFTYSQKRETDCSLFIGGEGNFSGLPCTIGYLVGAERRAVGEER